MLLIAMPLIGIGIKSSSLVCLFHEFVSRLIGFFFHVGSLLASRLAEALKEHALHRTFYMKLLSGLDQTIVEKWKELVTAWEDDQTKPSPFEEVNNSAFISYLDENKISFD
jgi:hypothetical protein